MKIEKLIMLSCLSLVPVTMQAVSGRPEGWKPAPPSRSKVVETPLVKTQTPPPAKPPKPKQVPVAKSGAGVSVVDLSSMSSQSISVDAGMQKKVGASSESNSDLNPGYRTQESSWWNSFLNVFGLGSKKVSRLIPGKQVKPVAPAKPAKQNAQLVRQAKGIELNQSEEVPAAPSYSPAPPLSVEAGRESAKSTILSPSQSSSQFNQNLRPARLFDAGGKPLVPKPQGPAPVRPN